MKSIQMKASVGFLASIILTLLFVACSQAPVEQDTLVILQTDDILTLDPNSEFEAVTDSVLFNAFEPLVGFDKDLNLQPVLAESWENPQPVEWRFHLRKNVRFHDGTPLTSEIVRQSLLETKGSGSEISNFLSVVKEIRALDEHTVSVITEKPYAILIRLPFIYITKKNKDSFPEKTGTGPYRVMRWDKGRETTLESSEDYWGRSPAARTVRFIPVEDENRRYEQLVSGKADIVYSATPSMMQNSRGGIHFVKHPGLTVNYIGFSLKDKVENPYRDLRVRRAIHHAINRSDLVERVLLRFGSVANQPVAPFVFGFDPALPQTEYAPEKARQWLKEAGHPQGFRTRLDFSSARLPIATLIRDQLAKVGIEVELNAVPRSHVYDLAEKGHSDFYMIGWDCTTGDAAEFYEFNMHTRQKSNMGIGNYGYYSNQEMDEICQTNSFLTDQRERKKLLHRAAAIVMSDLPVLPILIQDDIYAMKKGIHFEPRADSEIRLLDVILQK